MARTTEAPFVARASTSTRRTNVLWVSESATQTSIAVPADVLTIERAATE